MTIKGNAIVAQSGGPTAVINNSVCGVIQEWMRQNTGGKMFAGISGIKGILEGKLMDMGQQDSAVIEGLKYTPGAALHSCRHKVTDQQQKQLIELFKKYDIRYFFYNGGNDSMDTTHKTYLAAQAAGYELYVMGVPKTIDNDLIHTDHCPGFGSAAKYIATTVRETGIDLESVSTKNKVTILEAMGRNAGWLTASAALAKRKPEDAPHLIYLPETPFSKANFIKDVEKVYNNLGYVYVVVSEGLVDENGDYCFVGSDVDDFGHKQLSGVGVAVADLVEKELGIKARCNTLGTAQRSAMHFASACDAGEAYMTGADAVKYALAGNTGMMVAIQRLSDEPYQSGTKLVPLEEVANAEFKMPVEWINQAGNYVTADFLKYAAPLIEGEVKLPMKNGLPDYVSLDFSKGWV